MRSELISAGIVSGLRETLKLPSPESLIYSFAFSLSVAAQSADLTTTYVALRLGAEELNPILGGIYEMSGFDGMSTYKALVAGLSLGIAECRKLRTGYKGSTRMLLIGDIATFGAVTLNAAQLLHLR